MSRLALSVMVLVGLGFSIAASKPVVAQPAVVPSARSEPGPRPATAAEARAVIDLRTVTKLDSTRVLDESATYLYYSAKSSIPAATGLYQSELEASGWKLVPDNIPDNPQYRDLLFTKDGFFLRLTVGASGDEGVVGISLSNLGNVDLMKLPRINDAQPHEVSSPVNVNYEVTQGIPEAVKYCREHFSRLGWHEYGDLYTNLPEVPHVKQLNFCQNGNRLMVNVIRDPRLPNRDKTMVSYMAHHMLPYDVPVAPGGVALKLDTVHGRAEYSTSASVGELVDYYRKRGPELGWTTQPAHDQIGSDAASLYVQDEKELGFGIEITRKDDRSQVAFKRLSFAQSTSPSDGAVPTANDLATDESQETDSPAVTDESLDNLQKEIEDTVRKQLEAVQNQLKGLDSDVDIDIPTDILGDLVNGVLDQEGVNELAPALDSADEQQDESQARAAELKVADEALAKLEELATRCVVQYGDVRLDLTHAFAFRAPDNGATVLMFSQQPLNVARAQRALAKGDDVSVHELAGNQFPATMEIRLQSDYISINCFVDGASINRGSTDFKSDFLSGTRRVRGSVSMEEADEVFDKLFHFEATFDQKFLDAARSNSPDSGNDEFVADTNYELPVPEGCQEISQEGSPYRTSINARIEAPLSAVLAFYRRELATRGFKEVPATIGDPVKLTFASDGGPLTLTLQQIGDATQIQLVERNEAKAKQDKMAPAAGQGLLLLANGTEAEITVTFNKQAIKLPAGKGAEDPADAVKFPVLPGKHRVSIAAGGSTTQEVVAIEAGTTWGVIAFPGGGVFAQIVY